MRHLLMQRYVILNNYTNFLRFFLRMQTISYNFASQSNNIKPMTIDELKTFVSSYKRNRRCAIVHEKEVIARVSEITNVHRATVSVVVKCMVAVMRDILDGGEGVEIEDFGRFVLRDRLPRLTNDISKGGMVFTPPKAYAHFTPNSTWKWRQFARNLYIPDDFTLPEGVHFSERMIQIFGNNGMYGFTKEDGGKYGLRAWREAKLAAKEAEARDATQDNGDRDKQGGRIGYPAKNDFSKTNSPASRSNMPTGEPEAEPSGEMWDDSEG